MEDREYIRRAFHIEKKSRRQIERETGHDRLTINKALQDAEPGKYQMSAPRASPVLGEWQERVKVLWAENETLPRKQRLTAKRIYELIQAEGYGGSEQSVRRHVQLVYKADVPPPIFLKLEYERGQDAQYDWGEAKAVMRGDLITTQFALLRACYSRRFFVRAYPTQKQESFLDALAQSFEFFGGVFGAVWFDNLTTAVRTVLEGRNRREQRHFTAFRSHYLFESVFCTPAQGHEKGGVESGVGYVQRNLFSPLPEVRDFDELNAHLLAACLAQDGRKVAGQPVSIGQAWQEEAPTLKPLPRHRFPCCATVELTLDGYGLLTFETNRYSVPVEQARKLLTLKAYPYTVQILHGTSMIASHPRCYEKHKEIIDPVHFLPLLEQRTGAFEHSTAMRKLRSELPVIFDELLSRLRLDEGLGVREFVRVLRLLETCARSQLETAVTGALKLGAVNRDVIELILRTQTQPEWLSEPLTLDTLPSQLGLFAQNTPAPDLGIYDGLLNSLTLTTTLTAPTAPTAPSLETQTHV